MACFWKEDEFVALADAHLILGARPLWSRKLISEVPDGQLR